MGCTRHLFQCFWSNSLTLLLVGQSQEQGFLIKEVTVWAKYHRVCKALISKLLVRILSNSLTYLAIIKRVWLIKSGRGSQKFRARLRAHYLASKHPPSSNSRYATEEGRKSAL